MKRFYATAFMITWTSSKPLPGAHNGSCIKTLDADSLHFTVAEPLSGGSGPCCLPCCLSWALLPSFLAIAACWLTCHLLSQNEVSKWHEEKEAATNGYSGEEEVIQPWKGRGGIYPMEVVLNKGPVWDKWSVHTTNPVGLPVRLKLRIHLVRAVLTQTWFRLFHLTDLLHPLLT